MPEMSDSGHVHGESIFVTIGDAEIVLDGATGLYYSFYSCLIRELYAIGEREEGIGGHNRTVEIEPEVAGLYNGLF